VGINGQTVNILEMVMVEMEAILEGIMVILALQPKAGLGKNGRIVNIFQNVQMAGREHIQTVNLLKNVLRGQRVNIRIVK
jgi:hypothetical protein